MALSILSAPVEPVRLLGLVPAGIGVAWNNPPQTGMARSDPPVQWLKLRNFSCTGCGAIPVHNLSFIPEPKDRQPATLHGPDGRRIVLHSVIYVETLKACDWRWPTFDQAVSQPVIMDDSARENTLVRQRNEGEASVSLLPWEARKKRSGSFVSLITWAT